MAFQRLQWLEVDPYCLQTSEADEEAKITSTTSLETVKAVMRTAFYEGKTFNLTYVLPAHSVIVQALLNMNTSSIKKLYGLTSKFSKDADVSLRDVVSTDLNPLLLNMKLSKFRATVELLYYLKEYFLSVFGVALVNVMCSDKSDVLLILSQQSLTCNLCDKSAAEVRLFQCVECNVSTVCHDCMQTEKGEDYLMAHSFSCFNIQELIQPIIQTMTFAHLCFKCFTPLHKKLHKNHFAPKIEFVTNKKRRRILYSKASCSVEKCKRNLCVTCLKAMKQ
jgi:hypothetical protein